MNQLSRIRSRLIVGLLAVLAFFSLNPFFIWSFTTEIRAAILAALFVTFICTKISIGSGNLFFGGLAGIATGLFFWLSGHSYLGCAYSSVFIFLLFQFDSETLCKAFFAFKRIFAISLIPGLCFWLVHHITGDFDAFQIGVIDNVVNQFKAEKGQSYVVYPFSIVLAHMVESGSYRLFGPYDEPGVVGTFAALFLVAEGFKLTRPENIILLICGVFSFSLAFYFLFFVSYFLFALRAPKNILPIFLLVSLCGIFSQNEIFSSKVLNRVQITSDGGIAGDNRSSNRLEERFYAWWTEADETIFWGRGKMADTGDSSWKQIPLRTGVLGSLIFMALIVSIFVRHLRHHDFVVCIFFIAFIASIYQRPNVITPSYLLLFAGGVIYRSQRLVRKREEKFQNEGA